MRPAQVSRVARTALKLQQRTVAAAATAAAPAAGSLASALNQQLSGAQSPRARATQTQVLTPQQAFEAHTAAHFYGSSRPGMDGFDDGEATAALLREHLAAVFAAEAHTAAPGIPSAQLGAAGGPTDRNTARTAAAAVQARLIKSGAKVAGKAQ
jgi:hypothetical protein